METIIICIIIPIIIILLHVIDFLIFGHIADNMFIGDETYNYQYITALNEAVNYHEKQLGRKLTKKEYNKLKYKIFGDFYGANR